MGILRSSDFNEHPVFQDNKVGGWDGIFEIRGKKSMRHLLTNSCMLVTINHTFAIYQKICLFKETLALHGQGQFRLFHFDIYYLSLGCRTDLRFSLNLFKISSLPTIKHKHVC